MSTHEITCWTSAYACARQNGESSVDAFDVAADYLATEIKTCECTGRGHKVDRRDFALSRS